MEVDNKDNDKDTKSACNSGDERENVPNENLVFKINIDSKPINFTNNSHGSAGYVNQNYFGSPSKLDDFINGLGDKGTANTLQSNANNVLSPKVNDNSKISNLHFKHSSTGDKNKAKIDLDNLGKYNGYSSKWGSSKINSSSSENFKFSGPQKTSSTSSEAGNAYTAKQVESYVILDLIKRLNDLTIELSNNKRSLVESKKRLGTVVSRVSSLTTKTENFDASLKDAEDKLSTKVSDFENEIVTARNSLLAVIALFASFFTFISISVNIFSRDMSLSTSISVLLVIWCCLISFIFVFMAGINKGGAFFTSMTFFKHALCMVMMFICAFTLPRFIFYVLPLQWFP